MKFSQQTLLEGNVIRSYAPGEITIAYPEYPDQDSSSPEEPIKARINEETLTHSVIVTPDTIVKNWPPQSFDELRQSHIEQLSEFNSEVVILGTGQTLRFPAAKWIAVLHGRGIGFEVMDTGAACRTYNILMSDGRKVLAALLSD